MSKDPELGRCLRALRLKYGWTLQDVSQKTGVALSTLSKVENGIMTITYDKILQICGGLSVTVADLLSIEDGGAELKTRRSLTDASNTLQQLTPNYDYRYLCTELKNKAMVPLRAVANCRSLEEFGPLIRHKGEEFIFVISGEIEMHTEHYAPVRLAEGQGAYIDANMGHAYLAASKEHAEILCICTELSDATP